MYYPYFISYMLAGVAISLVVFAWAVHNGQFKDQQRARFLPLVNEPPKAPVKATLKSRIEVYALFGIVVSVMVTSFSFVIFAIIRVK